MSKDAVRILTPRNVQIYEMRVCQKKTFIEIAKSFNLSNARVMQLYKKVKKFNDSRWYRKSWLKHYKGRVFDPDGLGEVNETWTAEDQYEEMKWEQNGKSL
jgi:hypothetical protein